MRSITRVLLSILVIACAVVLLPARAHAEANMDDATARKVDELIALRAAAGNASKGELIDLLSGQFMGTPYGANMLVGSATQAEQLVIDLRRVDCFTYLDYVEALTRSSDRNQFVANLIDTRYAGGQVDFAHRKHFFTDWAQVARTAASDITGSLTGAAVTVGKHLNAKADGGNYLPGLPVVDRNITYIPSSAVTDQVLSGLRTGDYVGAYTDQPGLDVTHVGIIVKTNGGTVFRNASSLAANNQVVDQPLTDYLGTVPGIVVLRPQ
ncbi:DUF1460 domain-containing protein [Nocardia inohanensis]|uniref:DUF1460 domain-containing protein n=1 Tax=Nocardia inohanensis TaxID=209246 RepID=UPI000829FD06|nr:DUF1460 domain-containing protein [Nocardia inohanensis]